MSHWLLDLRWILVLVCLVVRAGAQETPPMPREAPAAGGVEEVDLPTIYLKNKEGNLVPVPGMTYERMRELLLRESRTSNDPPPYSIEKLALRGAVDGQSASLQVEATIELRKDGWIAIPFRMPKTVLSGEVKIEDGGEIAHRYEPKEGHLIWVRGSERQYTVTFPIRVQLQRAISEDLLSLGLPKTSESTISLDVPGQISDAALRAGDGLVELLKQDAKTQITVRGAAGDVQLGWRPASTSQAQLLNVEARSEVTAIFESGSMVSFASQMRITRAGTSLRSLLVRLPPHTELLSKTGAGFTARAATSEELAGAKLSPDSTSIIRVDFERVEEISQFTLEAVYRGGEPDSIELGGFEVLGIGRQSGYVSVVLPTGWSLKAKPSLAVIRVDDVLPTSMQARADSRYQFVRQPFSLEVEARPQPQRTVVEPNFLAAVEAQRIVLTATLNYQTRGPHPGYLELDPGEWTLHSAGPMNIIDALPETDSGTPLRVPLQPGAATNFTVQLQFHRNLKPDTRQVSFGLPQIQAAQRLPATLSLNAADNIILTPDNDAIQSLIADSRAESNGQRTLYFREVPSAAEPPLFSGRFQVRKRKVNAALDAHVQIRDGRAEVEQTMELEVAYEPITVLIVEAPLNASVSSVVATERGEPLSVHELSQEDESSSAGGRWRVDVPPSKVGPRQIAIRYSAEIGEHQTFRLPLITPVETPELTIVRQQAHFQSEGTKRLSLGGSSADRAESISDVPQGLGASWSKKITEVELELEAGSASYGEVQRVERQWWQTWLLPGVRRDRFVAQIAGVHDEISITIPAGVLPQDVRVLVDGSVPDSVAVDGQSLRVQLSTKPEGACTLELWYVLAGTPTSLLPQRELLEIPKIVRASTPTQSWMHVITSPGEQVLFTLSGVSSQNTWRKRGFLWHRASGMTTAELEGWSGATQSEQPPEGVNDALFMTLGPLQSLEIVVWGSRWLWIVATCGVMLVGLLVYVLSQRRSLLMLGGLATSLMVAAMLFPELALNLGHFLGLGVIAFLAVAWSWRVAGVPLDASQQSSLPPHPPYNNRNQGRDLSGRIKGGSSTGIHGIEPVVSRNDVEVQP